MPITVNTLNAARAALRAGGGATGSESALIRNCPHPEFSQEKIQTSPKGEVAPAALLNNNSNVGVSGAKLPPATSPLGEVGAHLGAAGEGASVPIHLISPPFAACHAGVNYYRALVDALMHEFPGVAFTFTLCCGDNPAIAHDALRLGFTSILCDCGDAQLRELQAKGGMVRVATALVSDQP